MIFSVIVLLFLAIIGYWHYVQGMLAGVIAVTCALVAAALTISFHEQIVALAFSQKMSDIGTGLTLAVLYMVIFLVLRIIFDSLIPGNIRFPAIVDKVGGAILGLIAGAISLGIFATAAQSLPFGVTVGGYARYKINAVREVKIQPDPNRPYYDTKIFDELQSPDLTAENQDRMLVPIDDWVMDMIAQLSSSGALENGRPLRAVHPSYLDELFLQRLGMEPGAKHVIVNTDKQQVFTVSDVYTAEGLGATPAEIKDIYDPEGRKGPSKPIRSDRENAIIIVRASFKDPATEADHLIRMSPGSIRLVANSKNYVPLGTLEHGGVYTNRPDDYMFLSANFPVDFVFVVPREDVLGGASGPGGKPAAGGGMTVKNGVFIEAKRMARVPLGGMSISTSVPNELQTAVKRKKDIPEPPPYMGAATPSKPAPAPAANPSAPPEKAPANETPGAPSTPPEAAPPSAPVTGGPVTFVSAAASAKLPSPINIGKHGDDSNDVKFKSGSASTKDGKVSAIELHPADPLDALSKGEGVVTEFYADSGSHVVQVMIDPGTDPAAWLTVSDFELVDSSGVTYKPNGALAKVMKDGKEYLVGKYSADDPVATVKSEDGKPTHIALVFLVPDNTPLTAINYKTAKLADVNLK